MPSVANRCFDFFAVCVARIVVLSLFLCEVFRLLCKLIHQPVLVGLVVGHRPDHNAKGAII